MINPKALVNLGIQMYVSPSLCLRVSCVYFPHLWSPMCIFHTSGLLRDPCSTPIPTGQQPGMTRFLDSKLGSWRGDTRNHKPTNKPTQGNSLALV